MKINILTIFPKLFDSFLSETLIKKALQAKLLEINVVDIRAYTTDKHHTTDDSPYGGGPGMVMKIEPIFRALKALENNGEKSRGAPLCAPASENLGRTQRSAPTTEASSPTEIGDPSVDSCRRHSTPLLDNPELAVEGSTWSRGGNGKSKVALMSPRGRQFSQSVVEEYAKIDELTLICGRYEGVDYRVTEHLVDEELSIGPYVMSGGEVPAMVVVEAVSRYIPGVLGNAESLNEETFSLGSSNIHKSSIINHHSSACPAKPEGRSGEYPCYTKPEDFNGWKVPEVLLSGNHAAIKKWREENTR
jgi:tRNA (guanine37-N1)-methyltransferase